MADISEYILDPANPEATANYKKLRKILRGEYLVFVDALAWANILEGDIFSEEVLADMNLPENFGEMSEIEKAKEYIQQYSLEEWYEILPADHPSWPKSILGPLTLYTQIHAPRSLDFLLFTSPKFAENTKKLEILTSEIEQALNYTVHEVGEISDPILKLNESVIIFGAERKSFSYFRFSFEKTCILFLSEEDVNNQKFPSSYLRNFSSRNDNLKPILYNRFKDVEPLWETIQKQIAQSPKTSQQKKRLGQAYRVLISHIESLYIQDFLSIRNAKLSDLSNKKEIYFLGENGDGKTVLMQGILLALKWKFIQDRTKQEFTGRIFDLMKPKEGKKPIIIGKNLDGELFGTEGNAPVEFVYAYGVERDRITENFNEADEYGFMSLFHDSKYQLRSPVQWLKQLRVQELEEQNGKGQTPKTHISLETAIKMLKELLDDDDNEIAIEVTGLEATFRERGGQIIHFEHLSAGYKSVMTWVLDMVSRMAEEQPSTSNIKDFQGIVLVDEVGLHLHPKWEYNIVSKLREWFPKVQFFFTTHSPILILGASENAVIYKVYRGEDGHTEVSEPIREFHHLMPNALVTSPLFGLDTMRPKGFDPEEHQEAINREDFITNQIHEAIRKRLKASPGVVLEDEAQEWIEQELAKLDAEK